MYMLAGRLENAEAEFRGILQKNERYRPALKSLALVQAKKHEYGASRESLQKLLLLQPEDAEAWLHLGDVSMFMGESKKAREAWTRAASTKDVSNELRKRANQRLAILQDRQAIGRIRK
jgi:Flp pilus assembly protein TadD